MQIFMQGQHILAHMLKHVSKKRTNDFHHDKSMCEDFIALIIQILNNKQIETTSIFIK
jgi:hypothetical protein